MLRSTKDITQLQPIASKTDQMLSRFSINAKPNQRHESRTDTNFMKVHAFNFNTSVPKLSKPPNFSPGAALLTKILLLKRKRKSVE